jgi:hypothetical protein
MLTSAQLSEWVQFHNVSPIGGGRGDYLHAKLCAMYAGAHGVRQPKVSDYMPYWALKRKPRQMTRAEIDAVFARRKNKP